VTDRYYESKRRSALKRRDQVTAKNRQEWLAGKWRHLHKRQYTKVCELCGHVATEAMNDRMAYHHWDDSTPDLGLWICQPCHRIAEGMDKALSDPDLLKQYAALKDKAVFEHYSARLAF